MEIENILNTKEEKELLAKTNKIFNNEGINSSYKIGKLSSLINAKDFKSVKEWIDYYFTEFQSKEEFEKIIKEFHTAVNKVFDFSYEDAQKQMYQRIFYDTWNGKCKEYAIISYLKKHYPKYIIEKTNDEFDREYSIDLSVKENDKLIAGIQVKPISYSYDKDYLLDSKKINREKNNKFISLNRVPVFYLYYNNCKLVKNVDFNLLDLFLSEKIYEIRDCMKVRLKSDNYISIPTYKDIFNYNIIFNIKDKKTKKTKYVVAKENTFHKDLLKNTYCKNIYILKEIIKNEKIFYKVYKYEE